MGTSSTALKWSLRLSFCAFVAGCIFVVVGAALYFPRVAFVSTSCLVVSNNGLVLAVDGVFYGVVTASSSLASPVVQPNIPVTQAYSNAPNASSAVRSQFPVNSSFACLIDSAGAISADRGLTPEQEGPLAVFIIGLFLVSFWIIVALGTLIYSCTLHRPVPTSPLGRAKEWLSWWWMGPVQDWESSFEQEEERHDPPPPEQQQPPPQQQPKVVSDFA